MCDCSQRFQEYLTTNPFSISENVCELYKKLLEIEFFLCPLI